MPPPRERQGSATQFYPDQGSVAPSPARIPRQAFQSLLWSVCLNEELMHRWAECPVEMTGQPPQTVLEPEPLQFSEEGSFRRGAQCLRGARQDEGGSLVSSRRQSAVGGVPPPGRSTLARGLPGKRAPVLGCVRELVHGAVSRGGGRPGRASVASRPSAPVQPTGPVHVCSLSERTTGASRAISKDAFNVKLVNHR